MFSEVIDQWHEMDWAIKTIKGSNLVVLKFKWSLNLKRRGKFDKIW